MNKMTFVQQMTFFHETKIETFYKAIKCGNKKTTKKKKQKKKERNRRLKIEYKINISTYKINSNKTKHYTIFNRIKKILIYEENSNRVIFSKVSINSLEDQRFKNRF